ncbi:MAG: two-component regulator propeller domain-containing protein [Polaribacter sp.]|nr:two-component regulator propeller domain-containing protein [Polaribacter sp.]
MMRKSALLFLLVFPFILIAQTDFSAQWEDFYSYNNVKDFIKVNEHIYAISDNAVFRYNTNTQETQKQSSIQGFSGEITSAIHYHSATKRLLIGYENGLIEVLDEDGTITISADIVSFNQSGEKAIQHISEYNNKLYIATPFAIVVYDIEKLEFGDTYFIGPASSSIKINATAIFNDQIYAATEVGFFVADLTNPNLIDATNWSLLFTGNHTDVVAFNTAVYVSKGNKLFEIKGTSSLLKKTFSSPILRIKNSAQFLSVAFQKSAIVLNTRLEEVVQSEATLAHEYTLHMAFSVNNTLFLGTKEFGILKASFSDVQNFLEIHPKGPLSNNVFSIATQKNNAWFVYGGYNDAYTPLGIRQGFTHYNGEGWINTAFNPMVPVLDMVYITIDPNHDNKVFISSFADTNTGNIFSGGGLLEIVEDEITSFYSSQNSPLEDLFPANPNRITTRVNGTVFDAQGNLWITESLGLKKLKKLSPNGTWKSFDLKSLQTNKAEDINQIIIDKTNSLWMGTRRNGVYVYNETGDRKIALTTVPTKGGLPHANVRAVAVDKNNSIWIGTQSGMVLYANASGVFDAAIYDATPVIILDDGIPKKLLGDQTINTIAVDGADNKWFGTNNGGVVYTNPSGQKTLASFNKDNSPLPSNTILKISVDTSTGKVFFATDKGVVAYNSKVVPFGDSLGDVYAYPNPALKNHPTVTIDGRNGTHLPKGTNVKILDVSGNLVYETNVLEGQEVQGGKVVWNKKNLAGNKVASGIYIVLLSTEDASETTSTKIAIVN